MPHYELPRPDGLLAPSSLLLAVSGQMLVVAAANHCGNDTGHPDQLSAHTSRTGRACAWIRHLLAAGSRSH